MTNITLPTITNKSVQSSKSDIKNFLTKIGFTNEELEEKNITFRGEIVDNVVSLYSQSVKGFEQAVQTPVIVDKEFVQTFLEKCEAKRKIHTGSTYYLTYTLTTQTITKFKKLWNKFNDTERRIFAISIKLYYKTPMPKTFTKYLVSGEWQTLYDEVTEKVKSGEKVFVDYLEDMTRQEENYNPDEVL